MDARIGSGSQIVGFRGGIDTARTLAYETIWQEGGLSLCEASADKTVGVEQLVSGFDVA